MKRKFDKVRSACIPLAKDNIDTDQIIPARFLKAVSEDEGFFGENLFRDWRYTPDGKPIASFPLNDPAMKGREILVAGHNFGSGSSREHAAWALAGAGIRVVIAKSMADIHRGNELNNFVLPVIVSEAFVDSLFSEIERDPSTEVEVDVPAQTVKILSSGRTESFELNSYKKYCLLNALDDIDFLLGSMPLIEKYESGAAPSF